VTVLPIATVGDGVLFLDRVSDPRTFATWEQFERHHLDGFLRRVAPYTREAGSR
jgi:peptide deformylase